MGRQSRRSRTVPRGAWGESTQLTRMMAGLSHCLLIVVKYFLNKNKYLLFINKFILPL
jgi:hypothetical protein